MADNPISSDDFDKLLDDFISSQLQETEAALTEMEINNEETVQLQEGADAQPQESFSLSSFSISANQSDVNKLALEEKRLFDAYGHLMASSCACAQDAGIEVPEFKFEINDLLPRFRPSRIDNLSSDVMKAWELLIASQPVRLTSLPRNPTDEQILNFAEKTTDKNLQLALISYVETLIELEACEIAYNIRKVKYEKHKIEKKIYEEQQQRRDRMRRYIDAIKAKNFPIDAEMLVNNFFKTARKDADGAKKMLENNPATFAPIQIDKIPARFFGMIKAKPEDGKIVNKKIGKYLKNLKS